MHKPPTLWDHTIQQHKNDARVTLPHRGTLGGNLASTNQHSVIQTAVRTEQKGAPGHPHRVGRAPVGAQLESRSEAVGQDMQR